MLSKGVTYALLSALLFGVTTPAAKILVAQTEPVMLAGLLYSGSGIGLLAWFILRACISARRAEGEQLTRRDLPWLASAILAGGVIAPVLMMSGLAFMPASSASLLLNLESVLTVSLAWFLFKENVNRRVVIGMALIVAAGLFLSLDQHAKLTLHWGALAVIGACLFWAIDSNLTRKVCASDPVQIAGIKGLVAGAINLVIALALGQSFPATNTVAVAGFIGFTGYGLGLVLFVLALRHLGAARTSAYYSAAPFVGALVSLFLLSEVPGAVFWIATACMALGIWLHISETHGHEHTHF
jgi:drug/metabolite transporter (DMT)-like permease